MKYLFLFLISTPVFACKMTPESWEHKEKGAAVELVKNKSGQKDLQVRRVKKYFYIRTTRKNCIEYQVSVSSGSNCKMTAKIISERPCP